MESVHGENPLTVKSEARNHVQKLYPWQGTSTLGRYIQTALHPQIKRIGDSP